MICRFRSLLVVATLAISACSTGAPEFSVRFDSFDQAAAYDRGRNQFQAGQYGLAVQSFERAVAVAPNSVDALNGLGAAYDKVGRFDLAQRHYERALRLDPVSIQTLNNLGYSYYLQGRYDLAAVFLQDAFWLSQENPQVLGNRSLLEAAATGQVSKQPQISALPAVDPGEGKDAKPALEIVRISRREQALVKAFGRNGDTAITDVLEGSRADTSAGHERPMTVQLAGYYGAKSPEIEAVAPQQVAGDPILAGLASPHVGTRPPAATMTSLMVISPPKVARPPAATMTNLMVISPKPWAVQPIDTVLVAFGPPVNLVGELTATFAVSDPVAITAAQRAPASSRVVSTGYWSDQTQIADTRGPGYVANETYW